MSTTMPSRLLRSALFAAAVLALAAALPMRHLRLVKSSPSADEVMPASPGAIVLWFSQAPTIRLTRISLADSAGTKLTLDKVKSGTEEFTAMAETTGPLAPGAYTVSWVTASPDGHVVRGKFGFKVDPGAPAAVSAGTGAPR
jgi:hypothetical protein